MMTRVQTLPMTMYMWQYYHPHVDEDGFASSDSPRYLWLSFAAVPKFLQLHLDPASSNTLLASGNIMQNLKVTNSQHGKKSLVMRMRIGYKVNGKDVLEEGQINNFPRGL
ncbi:hypothetical protein Bca101_068600 [Brassica carinata]